MKKYTSDAPNAPKAIGPYSQAVECGAMVFLSGQIPLDPTSGTIVTGGIKEQTEQVLRNITAVLTSLGLTYGEVCKTTIFLTDLANFQMVNELYESALGPTNKPARSTVQVSGLPRGSLVEIEMIAMRG